MRRALATGALVALVTAGCGGAASQPPPPADGGSAFRSIGLPPIPAPPARRAGEAGAHTAYHPNGKPRSHGLYVVRGDRAVPHGIWTFWLADGRRQAQGRYHEGQPVGCFAIWSARGDRITGLAESGALRPAPCQVPAHPAAEVLEQAHGEGGAPIVDLSFQTFVAPGSSLGARTTRYATADPEMTGALSAIWRRRVGAVRFGGAGGVRGAEYGYYGFTGAALAGWGRQLNPWLDFETWGELGALFMHAKPQLIDYREGREYLWTPFGAGQAELSFRIGQEIELTAAGRLELRYPRNVERQTIFCRAPCDAMIDTWSTGGFAAGAVLGLRFLVY